MMVPLSSRAGNNEDSRAGAMSVARARLSLASFSSGRLSPTSPADKGGSAEEAEEAADKSLEKLNDELRVLAEIYPDVRPEVFREMLSDYGETSRLHIIADTLLKNGAKRINGRWRVSSTKGTSSKILKEVFEIEQTPAADDADAVVGKELVPVEETFRSTAYKRAVRSALAQEFKTLSRSAIDAVLAEQNYSYSLSRPILLGLASKSWRISFSSLLSKLKRSKQSTNYTHYMLIWKQLPGVGPSASALTFAPQLRPTSSKELDEELYATVLKPMLDQQRETQQNISLELATLLNEQEAEAVGAIYECECCFSDATFEAMAVCSEGTHVICFTCIQRSVSEALYGQSWPSNIDHNRLQVACMAPSDPKCAGCIPEELTRRAILQTKGGSKTLAKLQSRLAEESLLASGAAFVRCPFCTYAELDDLYLPPRTVQYRLNDSHPVTTLVLLLLAPSIVMSFLVPYLFLSCLTRAFPRPKALISNSVGALVRRTHLPTRFRCCNPDCLRSSCRECRALWRDPHTCHESAALSLRTTIEAARTAALKRTCPKCGLAFIKESGCNKMVCMCGYIMCYICRQGLEGTASSSRQAAGQAAAAAMLRGAGAAVAALAANNQAAADEYAAANEENRAYNHFCQHFRPYGGPCNECDKCDLYKGEDEDEIVKRAGERAERDWRLRQGLEKQRRGLKGLVGDSAGGRERGGSKGRVQEGIDWWVSMVFKC